MIIEIFNDFYDAIQFIETTAEFNNTDYFKAELYWTQDGRWRVGIITEQQMELDV
jgi:hypothetical protein